MEQTVYLPVQNTVKVSLVTDLMGLVQRGSVMQVSWETNVNMVSDTCNVMFYYNSQTNHIVINIETETVGFLTLV